MELLVFSKGSVKVSRDKQSGVVLWVTLVVLVLMILGTVAIVRSMDTSNVISGNFAFKETAKQASDRAITEALEDLEDLVNEADPNGGSDSYSNIRVARDASGIPTNIDWTRVPCLDENGVACSDADAGSFRIQYHIERQCTGNPTLTDLQSIRSNCEYEIRDPADPAAIAVIYRVLIRVEGPRSTSGMYEVMMSGPASIPESET